MEHLMSSGPLTITEAAKHFGRSQSATSELIERLIRRDLLVSHPDDRDRRRHLIWLTKRGRFLLEEERHVLSVGLVSVGLVERALQKMDKQQRKNLLDGWTALVETAIDLGPLESSTAKEKKK